MTDLAPEEHTDTEAPANDEPSAEDRARLYGWRPYEEFSGDPKDFRDAETFLKINDERAAASAERARKLEREVLRLTRAQHMADERWRDQERQRIRAEMAAAAEQGDVKRVTELADGLERTSAPVHQNEPPEVEDFRARNSWFGVDPVKTAQATRISNEVRAMNPNFSVADELKVVEAEMQRLYPTMRAQPSTERPRPAAPGGELAGGVRLAPRQTNAFERLPYSAKQQFESLKNQGVYTDAEREAYAADYNADTFTIERKKRA